MSLRLPILLSLLFAISAEAEPYVWKNVAIVGGGFVTGIVTHPKEKDLMYARMDVGGAYRWDQGAKRWIPLTDWIDGDHWSDMGIESIAIDPGNPDRVYMAVGTYVTNWSPINGAILRSDDRGKTWKRTDLPFKNGGNEPGRSMGERLMVDPHDGNVIFFGTRNAGLWKSSDRGETWTRVESFPAIATADSASSGGQWSRPLGIVFVSFDVSGDAIYAGVGTRQTSLYRSTDSGVTWSAIPNQPTGLRPNHIAQSPDGAIYISYGDDPGPNTMTDGAVWKFEPKRGEWTDMTPEKPTAQRKFGYGAVCVDVQKPGVVMASTFCRWNGGDDIYRSTDGGKTWQGIREHCVRECASAPWRLEGKSEAPFGHWIGDVEIDPNDSNRAMYVTGWGVWMTDDLTNVDAAKSSHWTFSQGIEETVVNNIISPPSGAPLLSAMWDIDGFRHEDLDHSPAPGPFKPSAGRDSDIDFAQAAPNIVARVYYGDNSHGAYSTDNGLTWTAFEAAPKGKGGGDVAVSADGDTFISAPDGGDPQVSHDHGTKWNPCIDVAQRLRVVSDRVDPKMFYAFDATSGTILVSTDCGDHFEARAGNLPRAEGFLCAMPKHAGRVSLASAKGLFDSADGGGTFRQITGVQNAKHIGYGKAAPGQEYCAAYIIGKVGGVYGFYRTDDLGASWVRINDDQHQFGGVTCITGDPRVYGRVYVGSSNRGILYGEPAK